MWGKEHTEAATPRGLTKKKRGRWTMTRKEGGGGREQRKIATREKKRAFQKRTSQMEVFSKSIAVCLAKLRKYVQFDIGAPFFKKKLLNIHRQFWKEKVKR